MYSREFPLSFRSLLSAPSATAAAVPAALSLSVRCHCGAIAFSADASTDLERCHCTNCRHSSCASYVPYVRAHSTPAEVDAASKHSDQCSAHGAVERLFCGRCRSSVGMLSDDGATLHLSLGCIDDDVND